MTLAEYIYYLWFYYFLATLPMFFFISTYHWHGKTLGIETWSYPFLSKLCYSGVTWVDVDKRFTKWETFCTLSEAWGKVFLFLSILYSVKTISLCKTMHLSFQRYMQHQAAFVFGKVDKKQHSVVLLTYFALLHYDEWHYDNMTLWVEYIDQRGQPMHVDCFE